MSWTCYLENDFNLDKERIKGKDFWDHLMILVLFNSLPTNKTLDRSNLEACTDYKINVTNNLKFVLGRVKNIVGKEENAGYQHFLLFTQCFQKAYFSWSLKVGIVW